MGSIEKTEGHSLPFTREPIAIVGSSCRFPGGATSPSKLWELLENPRDVVQEIPATRFNTKGFYHPDSQHHGSTNVKHAYLLDEDPRFFDRDFFSITPKEAEAMDPQQRLLLETVYEGLESTGYSMAYLRGSSTAVFVGCMSFDYQFAAIRGIDSLPQYHGTGTAASILANRVSYYYDWRGPSVAIDTACSSSLVAVHQAVSALRNGEAKMAVAAGSNLIIGPEPFVSESKLNMLSPNGRSYMWDSAADGYTRGEGFATVFLKTLSQAVADGDHIECLIRETGVNSDGKTPGITMPSSESQARLIRDTYARCGLNPELESDRPQYFEAHGTGTQAGDPIEARAIQRVFFPDTSTDGQLTVGSIKTVIGHTEGTAGVAGVLKASLAVQHGQIPANLHFNELNPKIRPFYNNLQIPTQTVPWPAVPIGSPRRVSVNSFGFGGTNAHAIIESWDGTGAGELQVNGHLNGLSHANTSTNTAGPFVLSANSAPALAASAGALSDYLRSNPDTDLNQLAYTLFRKTEFPFRAAFSGTSVDELVGKLETAQKSSLKGVSRTQTLPETLPPRILGVFTGQGAQWATMGKELYGASAVFRRAIDEMQDSLDTLPATDRPEWSLFDQLDALPEISRVSEATVSQPLCTALQVALVDVLHSAGIEFSAVVGHSSGEIGAAYAAGYLTATDAIRVAYYRGVHTSLAQGPNGARGKMMAVGMSLGQATAFCAEFKGAIAVAASNSQTSCTLAGDAEAIDEAHARLQEDGTFARALQVDTAYHSHHMKSCGAPYLESMKQCGVKAQHRRRRQCTWYSSVWGPNGRSRSFDQLPDSKLLEGPYWVDNMTQAVLFSQALARALNEDQCFDFALEVGPHPALKGPSSEMIKMITGISLPYAGVLKRGQNAVSSFADALGSLWTSFPSARPLVTFSKLGRAFGSSGEVHKRQQVSILKGLPAYSWDHPSLIWKESRAARTFRSQAQPRHELLGHFITHGENSKREVHWKQLIRLSEIPWLVGHRIQGEVLFPASGYLSMAYEAAVRLVDQEKQPLRLVELHNIDILRAMRLEEDSSGLEVVFTVRVTSQDQGMIAAEVACYSGDVDAVQPLDAPQAKLTAHFTAGVRLWLGEPDKNALPRRANPLLPLDTLDMESFYSSLAQEGFHYAELFQARGMLRRLNHAVVTVSSPPDDSPLRGCMHPAPVDTAFQGLLAGFSFPGDGRVGSIYLPTKVDTVRISMASSSSSTAKSVLTADARVTATGKTTLTGDVDLFTADDSQIQVQIRGAHLVAVGQRRDPWLYAGITWARDASYGVEPARKAVLTDEEWVLYEQLTRTAYFYLRQLKKKILPQELLLMGVHRKHMMTWVLDHLLPQIEAGQHPDIRAEWKNDTLAMVKGWRAAHSPDNNDMNILHAMGKNLVAIVRGTTAPLKVLTQDGMLDRLYVEGLGARDGNIDLAAIVQQLSHQHPGMRIVEVGAGTGGTTKAVMDALGNHYGSYTYTDISTGFFENARTVFAQQGTKFGFKTLNIETSPSAQGFTPGTFDMVISSNCLHATKSLDETLRHCRQLLRPGGRLVLLEITRDFLPTQLVMSTLPGWFLGVDDGRTWAPTVSVERWDELLRANGFAGVDVSSTPSFCSVIVAQAVDETVQLLRNPLAAPALPPLSEVLIIGDATGNVGSKLALQSEEILRAAAPQTSITVVSTLEEIEDVPKGAVVLSLCDLDSPAFRAMTATRFKGIQAIMENAEAVLWVTTGAGRRDPDANITVGLSSTLRAERMDLRLQFLDLDDENVTVDPALLVNTLLRLAVLDPSQTDADQLLWAQEPELALRGGALYVPRVQSLDTVNRRSAARHRTITQATSLDGPEDTAVVLSEQKNGTFELEAVPVVEQARTTVVRVRITVSSLRALACAGYGSVYACIGRDLGSGNKVLLLSEENSSIVNTAEDRILYRWEHKSDSSEDEDPTQLHAFIARALAEHLLDGVTGPSWIHGASSGLREVIDLVASERGVAVFQSTSDMVSSDSASFIHPYANEEDVQDILTKGLKAFVNIVDSAQAQGSLSALIRSLSPELAVLDKTLESIAVGLTVPDLRRSATKQFGHVHPAERVEAVAIDQVSTFPAKTAPTAVVDWSTTDKVNASVRPLSHTGLFSPDKTYLLCGMTGDLGISVCLWMVSHGARHIVVTSRNPSVDPNVLEYLSRKGATIRPMALDITDMDSLRAVVAEIKSAMPPIGGVMNAAMVLRDRLFHHMSWEDFAAVLGPKVTGSKNLSEIFGGDEQQLDFFICFSSTTSIVGSIGQSAYAAANHYMASLVRQRRARGLAASIVHIAILTGFGYIFRRDAEHAETIYKAILPRFERQAETDLHEMLAEAVVAGRPDTNNGELITGIRTSFQGEWRDDPRLSFYLGQEEQEDTNSSNAQTGQSASVKVQLAAADTSDPAECQTIVESCFARALGNLLELDPETLDSSMPVANLGIDSLVAIRVREWFLKQVGVDVPVLKIMSDTYSMGRMCEDVLVEWRKLNVSSEK